MIFMFNTFFDHCSLSSDLLFLLSIFPVHQALPSALGLERQMRNRESLAITSYFKTLSGRRREERNNQSTDAFSRIGFVVSCFGPITTLIEPSIIHSTLFPV